MTWSIKNTAVNVFAQATGSDGSPCLTFILPETFAVGGGSDCMNGRAAERTFVQQFALLSSKQHKLKGLTKFKITLSVHDVRLKMFLFCCWASSEELTVFSIMQWTVAACSIIRPCCEVLNPKINTSHTFWLHPVCFCTQWKIKENNFKVVKLSRPGQKPTRAHANRLFYQGTTTEWQLFDCWIVNSLLNFFFSWTQNKNNCLICWVWVNVC